MLSAKVIFLKTLLRLGILNLLRNGWYRLLIRSGWVRNRLPVSDVLICDEYLLSVSEGSNCKVVESFAPPCWVEDVSKGFIPFFSHALHKVGRPPDWFFDPYSGRHFQECCLHWTELLQDSDLDIKLIWEPSRFDWLIILARAYYNTGDRSYLQTANDWLCDWVKKNPFNQGPNWRCGQESSIRVMHLAMVAKLLGQHKETSKPLLQLVRGHLQRIASTISYAIAQDNNHGTSEAAALYIGGSWLSAQGDKVAKRYQVIGVKWLENRAKRLIEEDGSFSQYSTNYHRVMLDTYSMVEYWRQTLQLPAFSSQLYERLRSAALWLKSFTDPLSGDAPTLGANDGARLLPLTDTDYRDFRPSVQLACVLFAGAKAYSSPDDWDLPLKWLKIPLPDKILPEDKNRLFDNGGYAILRQNSVSAYIRFPRFRFRPSHADALHIDLWIGGKNFLRDSGTFSYNTETKWMNYFPGTESHNTIQFDDRDQMPRLSRFLFGDWLKTEHRTKIFQEGKENRFTASYKDRKGAHHQRCVSLNDRRLKVEDIVSGFKNKAVLRWRLSPGNWTLDGMTVIDGQNRLKVVADVPVTRVELVEGWESCYYLQREPLPVFEVEIDNPGTLMSEFQWEL